jgi:hypothetical protein
MKIYQHMAKFIILLWADNFIRMEKFQRACLLVIAIISMSCSQQKKIDDNSVVDQSLEQKAINVFKDSLMFKKIYSEPLEHDQIQLYPHNIDSVWITNGIFFGYKLLSEEKSWILSSPAIDSLSLISGFEYFTGSAKVEIKNYNDYYRKNENDSSEIPLKLPNGIEIEKKNEFVKRNAKNELFVQVKKKLISTQSQMVEITILKNREEIDFPIELRFLVYFDLNGNLLRWSFD